MLFDTHCHIHDSEFSEKSEFSKIQILERAKAVGVNKFICVGTSYKSSEEAYEFANSNDDCYFSVALHPHEAESLSVDELEDEMKKMSDLVSNKTKKLVAIGECGLDYFYHSEKEVLFKQELLFRRHIELALKLDLPMIFHIREAFDDFFRIIDEYKGVHGVVHSFSATNKELEGVLTRGLYVGLNGIMTFTKDEQQLNAAKEVPIDRLLLETDAPFLTPKPFRGTMCEPKHVERVAEFLSELRSENQDLLAQKTTDNATKLFNL